MALLGPIKLGAIAFLAIFSLTLNPVRSQEKCRSGCHGIKPHTFKYVDGTTYKYNLDGNIDVLLSTVEGQESSTKIKATVLLTQQPDCNQILRLQNVQVIGADGKKHSHIPNIEKPVRLNFHDGHVEDLICAEPDDSQVSLNIKRAVASMFQANIKKQYETDVFGVCPTDVQTRKEGAHFVVQKSKDLNRCSHRETAKQDFFATSFNLNSDIKTSPILNSHYFAEQKLKNGILDQATITENYLYVPFSAGSNGAKAVVTTKLHFAGTSKDAAASEKCSAAKSILFESPHIVTAEKSNANAILHAVKDATKTIGKTVGSETADKFLNLVRVMRASKRDDLLNVYNQVQSGAAGDKTAAGQLYVDALFRCGTGESIEVTIQLLKNKPLSEAEQKFVYLGLSFARHVTPGSIKAATGLLSEKDLPREAYLGIGTLAGRYCRTHPCENEESINGLTQKLLSKLAGAKGNTRAKEDESISILKAFGNMHEISPKVQQAVIAIAQDKKTSNRLRVAALETLQQHSCNDKARDAAVAILKDIQQDSEIRIKAYLAAVECPNGKVAGAIKSLLQSEPSYQVGGFIVTHLRNLRASANPDKEHARQQLGLINTNRNYPFDIRKYSYNQEFSYAIDSLGLGTSTESNVIYSQNSFLPRSTSWNMTAEVFGHTVNFIQIDTRQENLEKLLEHYFGPLGEFNKHDADEMGAKLGKEIRKTMEKYEERIRKLRTKRDIAKNEIDVFNKQVQIKGNELNNDLDLDFSVKLFGSELLFLTFKDDMRKLTPGVIVDQIFDRIDAGLDALKSFEHTYRGHGFFLDAELSYPTSTGFPLKITSEGVSSVQMQAKSHVDVRGIINNRPEAMKFSLIPSASVQINGRLTVDAYFVESGLKTATNLYTSTGSGLEFAPLAGGKGIEGKLSFPLDKHELISATHDVVLHNRELGAQETNVPLKFGGGKPFTVCVDHLTKAIGLNFCLDILRPNTASTTASGPAGRPVALPFPLDGNSKFSVVVNNDDLAYIGTKFVKHDGDKNGLDFSVAAIGKNSQRKSAVTFELFVRPEAYAKLMLESPLRTSSVEGRITNNHKEMSVLVDARDMDARYYGKFGLAISGGGNKFAYKPILDYQIPNVQPGLIRVDGQIVVDKAQDGVKYTFKDVKLIAHNKQTYSIDGTIGQEKRDTYFAKLKIDDGKQNAAVDSRFHINGGTLSASVDFKNSINPQANFNFKYEANQIKHGADRKLQLIHGPDANTKVNVLKITHKYVSYHKNNQDFRFEVQNHLSYPLLHINGKFDFLSTPKELDYELDLTYGKYKYGTELEIEIDKKSKGDYDVKFGVEGFKNKFEMKLERVVSGETSKVHNQIEHNGKKYELIGEIKHHYKAKDVNIGADLVLKVAGKPHPFKLKHTFILNPNELDTLLKVTVADKPIVDVFLKSTKGGNANGNVKIDLKDLLKATGQLKAAKGKGNSHVVVEFVKSGTKIKAESQFTIAAPTYDVDVTFYPAYEKDNSKKIALSTHNKVTEKSIDSKNHFDVLNEKLDVAFKGVGEGDAENGKLNGEYEVTLPNEMYFAGKIDRHFQTVDNVMNGNGFVQFERRDKKNAPGCKVSLKVEVKNTNVKEHVYDVAHHLAYESDAGKNFVGDTAFKRQKDGRKWTMSGQAKLAGNVLPHPFELETSSTGEDKAGDYKVVAKCGQAATFDLRHKYNYNGDKQPYENDFALEMHTPSNKFKVIKAKSFVKLTVPKNGRTAEFEGSGSVFVDDDGSVPDATIDVRGDCKMETIPEGGQFTGTVHFQKLDPITVAAGFEEKKNKGAESYKGHVGVEYANGKKVKLETGVTVPNKNEVVIDASWEAPHEAVKTIKLHTQLKSSEDGKHTTSNGKFNYNEKEYTFNTDVVRSTVTPSLSYQIKRPDGKLHKLVVKVTKSTPHEFGGELQFLCPRTNIDVSGKIDSKFEGVDDFFVKVNVHSASFKWEKIVAEAASKGSKGDKKIQFTITSAGKNLLSGSTNYKTSNEHGKFILEGSGNLKVKDQAQSANFKLTRQNLAIEKNGEEGVEVLFDAKLGSKAIDAEFKVTNRHVRLLNSYCEEKKQCSHFEVDSKLSKASETEYNHVLEINIDLRKLGLSHEFGLKSVTDVKDKLLDHTVDVHFQNQENSKYQYSVYVHPTETGVSLTTPKRIIAVESKLDVVEKTHVKGHVYAYLDKKHQPNKKLALVFDVKSDDGKSMTRREMKWTSKLSAPGLPKELAVSFDYDADYTKNLGNFAVVFDVFANANQKLVVECKSKYNKDEQSGYGYHVAINTKSAGLGINANYEEEFYIKPAEKSIGYKAIEYFTFNNKKYETGMLLSMNMQEANGYVKLLNRDLVNVHSKYQLSKESQIVDTTIHVFGTSPVVVHSELANYNTFHESFSCKAAPNKKLNVHAAFIVGQIADYRIEYEDAGKKHDLLHGSIKLDEANFLKSDVGVNYENIKGHVIQPMKDALNDVAAKQKQLLDETTSEATDLTKALGEKFKNSAPRVANTKDYYHQELNKIKEEFLADKTIQKFAEFLKNIFGAFAKTIADIYQRVNEFVEKIVQVLHANFGKTLETIEKEIIPMLRARVEQIVAAVDKLLMKVFDICFLILGKISHFLEQHQEQLKQISTVITQTGHEVAQAIVKITEGIRQSVTAYIQALVEEIKALPIFEELKTKYQEYFQNVHIDERLKNAYHEFEAMLKRMAPQQHELEKMIGNYAGYRVHPMSLDYLFKLPQHVAIKWSPITHITEHFKEFMHTLAFSPKLWLRPFEIQGIVTQGQHIFTFDGKHLTFPGKCNYLLVRDALNGNFSVYGTYTDGILTAITVADKENVATIKKDGKLIFNAAAHEYPVRKGYFEVFRRYDSVNIVSKAGVRVTCFPNLDGCVFLISGFYHGQLRGLLGNGNNEPYDDFVLPNGKVVTSESDFGNAYKASPSCPMVKTVDHKHHSHAPQCNKYFGDDDLLMSLCHPFVDPTNFRTACDHGVAAGVPNTEYATVVSYVAACHMRGVFYMPLPEEFLKCTNGLTERHLGDKFSVKTPAKLVDVVIAIDQSTKNEEIYKNLLQPLVRQVKTELGAKGITDINFHVIGYGGDYDEYPSHYTVGGDIVTKDQLPPMKFSDGDDDEIFQTDNHYVDRAVKLLYEMATDLDVALGIDAQSEAYKEAMKYPFRAEASKVLIAVTGEPCKHGRFLLLQYIRALLSVDKSINLNLITPFTYLHKDDKPAKNIIGFNQYGAFTFEKGKKDSSAELLKELKYNDYCVDLTINVGGNTFVANNFVESKDNHKKQFIQTTSHQIVEQIYGKELNLDCECKRVSPIKAKNVCNIVNVKDKHKKSK